MSGNDASKASMVAAREEPGTAADDEAEQNDDESAYIARPSLTNSPCGTPLSSAVGAAPPATTIISSASPAVVADLQLPPRQRFAGSAPSHELSRANVSASASALIEASVGSIEGEGELGPDGKYISGVRILHNPPVQNCELRPFVLVRDSHGKQSAAKVDSALSFSWSRGQQRLCSVTHCCGGAKLQCLMCLKCRLPAHLSYFCSTEHWAESWPAHRQMHAQNSVSKTGTAARRLVEWRYDDGDDEADECAAIANQNVLSDYDRLNCKYVPLVRNVWGEVSTSITYTPRQDDVGRMLHLEVRLLPEGDSSNVDPKTLVAVCKDTSPVLPEPEAPPPRMMVYHPTANPSSATAFRVMCYNTLAAIYATRHVFPYCALWALLWNYRRNMILRELRQHQPDIICLQEVQGDHFEDFFQPQLKEQGYDGIFKMKTRAAMGHKPNSMDGCAIFYKTDRFALMEQYSIEFNEAARQRFDGRNEYRSGAMRRLSRGNIALVVVLEEIIDVARNRQRRPRKRRLCVANTHIFWDPEYEDVKLWQTLILCQELEKLVLTRNLPLILCGDFNSKPDSPVFELINSERVYPDHQVFHMDNEYNVLPPPEAVTHRLPLSSAYAPHEPRFTNFTGSFVGVLDYIFFAKNHLRTLGFLEMPVEEIVSEFTAIPSPRFPSDHLPLVADFDWLNT